MSVNKSLFLSLTLTTALLPLSSFAHGGGGTGKFAYPPCPSIKIDYGTCNKWTDTVDGEPGACAKMYDCNNDVCSPCAAGSDGKCVETERASETVSQETAIPNNHSG